MSILNIKTLAHFVADLKGVAPEPSRTVICRKLTALISESIKNSDQKLYSYWLEKGRLIFSRECNLTCEDRWVPDDLHVEATQLALFCNKWMSVEAFRLRSDPDEGWRPITPEQNALRVTMIEELKSLAEKT
jgi:hypothetical protein